MPAVLWFRRDLRLRDHPALLAAAENDEVLACFVLDPRLEKSSGQRRLQYLGDSLRRLRDDLDGRLLVTRGQPDTQIPHIAKEIGASAVHISEDFAPFGKRRDERVRAALDPVPLVATGSPYLVSPGRVTKPDGSPYKVFTPFLRQWQKTGWREPAKSNAKSASWLDPAQLRIKQCEIPDPGSVLEVTAGEAAARKQWKSFVDNGLQSYADDRNRPDLTGTSRMSAHLKFGAIHPRTLVADLDLRGNGAQTFSGHRAALRQAVHRAGPAIVASNATVVLALLTLLCASTPSTRSLGALAACGLVVAAISVLVILPPLLAVCGRRLFWPFIPHAGGDETLDSGGWHRVAEWVGGRPALVAVVAIAMLAGLGTGLLGTRIGLSQTEQFRIRADSVAGYNLVAEHFPAGLANPTLVVSTGDHAARVQQAIASTPGVVSVTESGRSASGLTKWSVVIDAPPSSKRAFSVIAALRNSTRTADHHALVGGADAQALDIRDAATHDRVLLIPAILAVILVVLYVLFRSVLAPPTLLAATILGALAALGMGAWANLHIFGFPALDNTTPLFAFLFLAALGVDYTIFLVTRAREEAARHGARTGMIRAVSATGGVITSAGIVLAAVFCVLGVLPLIVLTQLGIIVGLGIMLDTFVVRTLVIPALFALIGDRIWWPASPTPTEPGERQADRKQPERSTP